MLSRNYGELASAQRAARENEDAKSQLFELKKQMTKANLEAGRSGLNGHKGGKPVLR